MRAHFGVSRAVEGGYGGAMSDARDPAVQQALTRLSEVAPQHRARPELLVPLVTASPFLARFLAARPEALDDLAELPPPRDKAGWLAFLTVEAPDGLGGGGRMAAGDGGATDEARFGERLRAARHRAFVSIAGKELATGDALGSGAELSAFAAAAIERALSFARGLMRERYGEPRTADGAHCPSVVIAMGKLGADELDFGSDLDLLYVYGSDHGATDGARGLGASIDLHTYHARLFAKLTQLLSEGPDGAAFRVDLDQRPEGRTGPICNSAEALERYYESFGHEAERLAWAKARPVAGDLALGERVIASLEPFVYRKSLDLGFADDVLAMKRRIDQAGARLNLKPGFNVKLGRGGLREIEFVVQALQLAWGGRLPDLRARDTRTALQRLALAGLVDAAEADGLLAAYRFLRRIEHLLQLEDDRHTHVLPADPGPRRRVAALMMPGDGDPLPRFEAALDEHRKRVRAAFEALMAGGEHERALQPLEAQVEIALDGEVEAEARDEALVALGFMRPELSRNRLDALARRPDSPFHPQHLRAAHGALSRLAKKIMLALAQTPDPDAALSHVDALLRALRHRQAALAQLDEDARRLTALVNLFGTSHFLSRLLVRSPGLLDRLVLDGKEPTLRSRHDMARMLAAEVAASPTPEDGPSIEAFLGAARRFHTAEVLRIGFFDLAGLVDDPAPQLTDLADVIVLGLLDAVRKELAAKMGVPPATLPAPSIVALGAFGARELGYHSELELALVVPDAADPALALRISRALVTALSLSTVEGSLYRLDARQRPTGTRGPLSVTAARWREHHLGGSSVSPSAGVASAAPWEHEMVLHARVLGSGDGADDATVALVDALSRHAATVLAAAPQAHAADAAQEAHLDALARVGRLPEADARAFVESRRYLRHLDNRLAIVQELGAESLVLLAADPTAWSAAEREHVRRLALRLGYGDAPERVGGDAALALVRDVQRHRQVVSDLADKHRGPTAGEAAPTPPPASIS